MGIDLPLLWAGIIAFGIAIYVALDGFDLGIGILFPIFGERDERDVMMNTVAPIWDGNETWLVLGGAALFGAFPLAYAVLLPALYLPLTIMLLALVFRGVAFEFRFKANRTRVVWDWAFAGGSIVATFCQGVALGAFIQGVPVVDRQYAGGAWDWLSPFSLFAGVALVAGYAALACGWLIMRTEGALQERFFRTMPALGAALLATIGAVSIWTPLMHEAIAGRWFAWPNLAYFAPVPILVGVIALLLWHAVRLRWERLPFFLTLGLFFLGYTGLAISLWPNIVPPSISIWEAAAPPASQGFLIVGVAFLLPLILGYTAFSYWVFRGKVRVGDGYH